MNQSDSMRRRVFLGCVGQTAAVGVLASQGYAASSGVLTHDDFVDLVGDRFQVSIDGKNCPITLVETQLGKSQMPNATRAPFSIVFNGPKTLSFQQETYRVSHPKLGSMNLFLTPTGLSRPDTFTELEAVFG